MGTTPIYSLCHKNQGKTYYEDELPIHRVSISYSFEIGKYEVTQFQWEAIMDDSPWSNTSTKVLVADNNPAAYISWNDTQDLIAELNRIDPDHNYRLPTEAEWEYCCRAGSDTDFYFGDAIVPSYNASDFPEYYDPPISDRSLLDSYAWFTENSHYYGDEFGPHEVGQKLPNPWGLYDMHGNVYEWCQDRYHISYDDLPVDGTAWEEIVPNHPIGRIQRGGSWLSAEEYCRSASRFYNRADMGSGIDGIRLVRTETSSEI